MARPRALLPTQTPSLDAWGKGIRRHAKHRLLRQMPLPTLRLAVPVMMVMMPVAVIMIMIMAVVMIMVRPVVMQMYMPVRGVRVFAEHQ